MQFDEKWSFVGKKEKHCDPDDPNDAKQGDNWDHVALDPEHRLVVSVVPGKRTAEKTEAVVQEFKQRTGDRPMNLITSDEYKPYRGAILKAYGERVVPRPTGKPGRPKKPYYKSSPGLKYATVHKTRNKGRVVKIGFRVVFGTETRVRAALKRSKVSSQINTAFVERLNRTLRAHVPGLGRREEGLAKTTEGVRRRLMLVMGYYNLCLQHVSLRQALPSPIPTKGKGSPKKWIPRTPAMAGGITDHVWSMEEFLLFRVPPWRQEATAA